MNGDVPAAVVVDDVRACRRRAGKAGELAIDRVRADERSANRGHDRHGKEREANLSHLRPANAAERCPVRGSTSASAASDSSVPAARKIDPAAAQPVTRYTSRARSAFSISWPRPGHAVIVLDRERAAQKRPDHQAVDRRDRAAARS